MGFKGGYREGMFIIRGAEKKDIDGLYRLAGTPGFLTLQKDRVSLEKKIKQSIKSFKSQAKDPRDSEYLFVLEDLSKKRVVGCCLIVGQHGTPESPHMYFSVLKKKKYSRSLKVGLDHEVLRLNFDYDGPTELGGLILDKKYRGHPEKLGKFLSYTRFVYMAARLPQFREHLLCELLPPFDSDGRSPIWEDIGRKFTKMDYDKADKLSQQSNEFIHGLFPEGDIYTCFLSKKARQAIGQVGPHTQPVKAMLESIGFKYTQMIDPFDGGPHYWAKLSEVSLIRRTQRLKLYRNSGALKLRARNGICLHINQGEVKAIMGLFDFNSKSELVLNKDQKKLYSVGNNSEFYFLEIK